MTVMSVEPDSPYLGNPQFYDALLEQALFLEAAFNGTIAEPSPESDTTDPRVTCPVCSGEGVVGIEYDPHTGLWHCADTCSECEGEGSVDLEVAFA